MDIELGDWQQVLAEEIKKQYFLDLLKFLKEERKNTIIFPKEEDIFQAFLHTPYSKVKVVIMGQDPYHGDGEAHGLSFSVKKGLKIPPSLKNIQKELQRDLQIPPFDHGCLIEWANQGVLLLNAVLTVEKDRPNSHKDIGWERFTDAVIEKILEKKEPCVFLLLGKKAQEKLEKISFDLSHHIFLKAAHPSPFSARLFHGSSVFSKINSFLLQQNQSPIDWRIENG